MTIKLNAMYYLFKMFYLGFTILLFSIEFENKIHLPILLEQINIDKYRGTLVYVLYVKPRV